MDRKLIWTEKASGDIEAIVRYIARRNPNAGTILDELREGRWRKLIFRRWKIVYTIREDAIIIGRVWPAAMGEADWKHRFSDWRPSSSSQFSISPSCRADTRLCVLLYVVLHSTTTLNHHPCA
jgi:plasmid stabilization system protein ParE